MGFLLKIKLIKLKYKKIFLGVYFLISMLDKKEYARDRWHSS